MFDTKFIFQVLHYIFAWKWNTLQISEVLRRWKNLEEEWNVEIEKRRKFVPLGKMRSIIILSKLTSFVVVLLYFMPLSISRKGFRKTFEVHLECLWATTKSSVRNRTALKIHMSLNLSYLNLHWYVIQYT